MVAGQRAGGDHGGRQRRAVPGVARLRGHGPRAARAQPAAGARAHGARAAAQPARRRRRRRAPAPHRAQVAGTHPVASSTLYYVIINQFRAECIFNVCAGRAYHPSAGAAAYDAACTALRS